MYSILRLYQFNIMFVKVLSYINHNSIPQKKKKSDVIYTVVLWYNGKKKKVAVTIFKILRV